MNSKPNIIVFFTDQQRWDSTSLQGNPLDLMPNFNRMAQEGTYISHSFTCQPVCGPARSSLQTGLYATETGCWKNEIPLDPSHKTLAHYFKSAGYDTGYIGKWHLGDPDHSGLVPKEFQGEYDYWLAANKLEFTSDAYQTALYDNDGKQVDLPGYRVDALTDATIRYIDGHKEKPFFLFLSFLEPHHQNCRDDYPAPDGYETKFNTGWMPPDLQKFKGSAPQHYAGYCGMIKRLDEALGRVRDALKSLHLDENTIVLFTSDHGCHFKTRNGEYKRSCHESSSRVPTAFYGPGFVNKGRVDHLVSLVDLPPTLLDSAGITVPGHMQGKSILHLLGDKNADWQDEIFMQISEAQVGRALRTRKWKYGVTAPGLDGYGVSHSDTYVEQYLYDLENDPYELENLAGNKEFQNVSATLRERLLARILEVEKKSPTIQPL